MTSESMETPAVAESQAVAATENLVGRRVVAGAIDVIVLTVVFLFMAAIWGDSQSQGSNVRIGLNGWAFVAYLGIVLVYHLILEGLAGQTLGKKIMGLRVVAMGGTHSGWGQIEIRTILRLIDWLPLFYFVGIISIAVSQRRQRLGDMAAQTLVVKA
jgi:uncharacterized RDD family membrane protein YckC